MKKLTLFLSALLIVTLMACGEDPLGIEENLISKIIDSANVDPGPDTNVVDTTKKEIKTKFQADSILIRFSEKIIFLPSGETAHSRWTPLLFDSYAIIDTSNEPGFDKLFISAQRYKDDSLANFRKEVILGFGMELDSFKLVREYTAKKNNRHYKSKLNIWIISEREIVTINGEYPIEINFAEFKTEENFLVLSGEFVIDVPLTHQQKKYNYLFKGEMIFKFKLEE
jgi:hypothetical protein